MILQASVIFCNMQVDIEPYIFNIINQPAGFTILTNKWSLLFLSLEAVRKCRNEFGTCWNSSQLLGLNVSVKCCRMLVIFYCNTTLQSIYLTGLSCLGRRRFLHPSIVDTAGQTWAFQHRTNYSCAAALDIQSGNWSEISIAGIQFARAEFLREDSCLSG